MEVPFLSYIITTYNKLNYLKITLPLLIESISDDEEIVIVDGGSTDGTKEYLEELLNQKKIQHFLSEKDFGEAHGTNKALLLAKGEFVKIITDDDIYNFNLLKKIKSYLFQNRNVDVLFTSGFSYNISNKTESFQESKLAYLDYKNKSAPFFFCGLSLFINKKSIPLLGLFHTSIKIVDFEYTLRITNLKINLKYCETPSYINIVTPNSNSTKFLETLFEEQNKLDQFYLNRKTNQLQQLKVKLYNKLFKPKEIALTESYEEVVKRYLKFFEQKQYSEIVMA